MTTRTSIARLILLASFAVCASAAPVTWTLTGVTFADGGTASGSFQYDAATNSFSNVNITTTGGSSPGRTYSVIQPTSNRNAAGYLTVSSGDLTGTPYLLLYFTPSLTSSGGTVPITGSEGTCIGATCNGITIARGVAVGSVTGNPPAPPAQGVPATTTSVLIFTGVLVVGMVWYLRRREAYLGL